jgi:hypothetical protein
LKDEQLLERLLDLARSLDFDIRTDRGSFRDGACRVDDKRIIILNRTSPVTRKVAVLSAALSEVPLEGVFLLPAVREAIDKAKHGAKKHSAEKRHG